MITNQEGKYGQGLSRHRKQDQNGERNIVKDTAQPTSDKKGKTKKNIDNTISPRTIFFRNESGNNRLKNRLDGSDAYTPNEDSYTHPPKLIANDDKKG